MLKVLQSVYSDGDIIQSPQNSYCLDKLGLGELVEGLYQHVYLDAALVRTHKVLNDDWVPISLILNKKCMRRVVDKLTDPLAPIPYAPNQVRVVSRAKFLSGPTGLKAFNDLANHMPMGSNDP
jgi:hypothetical protein